MENTLKETEWLTINKVLLEMYDITDIDQFTERFHQSAQYVSECCK
jgi:hypothetical protein